MEFKPKMRIQLQDKNGVVISDRLVVQDIELMNGPKLNHNGPFKIELNPTEADDIDKIINYLKALKGELPIIKKTTTAGRGRPPGSSTSNTYIPKEKMLEDKRNEILAELEKPANVKDQEAFIKYLREQCNFVLLTEEHMEEINLELNLKSLHKGKYQWFFRCLKLAKDPRNDKFDPLLAFGIKVLGTPSEKVLVYVNRDYKTRLSIPVPDKKFIFKKMNVVRFPKYMTPEERTKFRKELRDLGADPQKQKSKFFLRWEPDVSIPDELKIGDR